MIVIKLDPIEGDHKIGERVEDNATTWNRVDRFRDLIENHSFEILQLRRRNSLWLI